jgi:hypothetical protein
MRRGGVQGSGTSSKMMAEYEERKGSSINSWRRMETNEGKTKKKKAKKSRPR